MIRIIAITDKQILGMLGQKCLTQRLKSIRMASLRHLNGEMCGEG